MKAEAIKSGDALLIIDMQNDFLPGGRLAVPDGEQIIPVINCYVQKFDAHGNPVLLTRDWHPANHASFNDQGGPWSLHCVAGTYGAEYPAALLLPETAQVFSKGTHPESNGYSGFEDTDLRTKLERAGARRLFIAGLATDYCVLQTVLDARRLGYKVLLLQDAVRAVNVNPDDGDRALQTMRQHGALLISLDELS